MSWSHIIDENEELKAQLSLSAEREERYRKSLEEIELQTSYVGGKEMPIVIIKAHNIARTALDEGKEEFTEYLERASKIVESWPEWKRNLLGKIDFREKPTPPTPPVTVDVDQLAYAIECYMGDGLFSYHDLAANLLSKFKLERKP